MDAGSVIPSCFLLLPGYFFSLSRTMSLLWTAWRTKTKGFASLSAWKSLQTHLMWGWGQVNDPGHRLSNQRGSDTPQSRQPGAAAGAPQQAPHPHPHPRLPRAAPGPSPGRAGGRGSLCGWRSRAARGSCAGGKPFPPSPFFKLPGGLQGIVSFRPGLRCSVAVKEARAVGLPPRYWVRTRGILEAAGGINMGFLSTSWTAARSGVTSLALPLHPAEGGKDLNATPAVSRFQLRAAQEKSPAGTQGWFSQPFAQSRCWRCMVALLPL